MKPRYKVVPLDQRAYTYLSNIGKDNSRATVEHALQPFYSFRLYGGPTPLSWKQMDVDVLARYHRWLLDRGYAQATRHLYLYEVKELFRYANLHKWLAADFSIENAFYVLKKSLKDDPFEPHKVQWQVPLIVKWYDERPEPDPHQAGGKVQLLCLYRDRAFVHCLLSSGARCNEIGSLTLEQVQGGAAVQIVIKGKGSKYRPIYLSPEARLAIKAYLGLRQELVKRDHCQYLFANHGKHKGTRVSNPGLWAVVLKAATELHLHVTPHDFRRYRASLMLEDGVPLEEIQEFLGHSYIDTTRRYYAQYSDPTKRAIAQRHTLPVAEAIRRAEQVEAE